MRAALLIVLLVELAGVLWLMRAGPEALQTPRMPLVESRPVAQGTSVTRTVDDGLTEWDIYTLQHARPIWSVVKRTSTLYDLDPVMMLQALSLESSLDPFADDPQYKGYGLSQMSPESYERLYPLGLDPGSRYHDPELEPHKSIFDPKTNIQLFAIDLAVIRDETGIEDFDRLYAIYARGPDSLDAGGNIQGEAVEIVRSMREKRRDIEDILPLLYETEDPKEEYMRILAYDMGLLEDAGGTMEEALMFATAQEFSILLDRQYGVNQDETYARLRRIGGGFDSQDPEARDMVAEYLKKVPG